MEDFFYSDNYLINLKGSPHTVKGSFYCYNNLLDSLEGAPKEVKGCFSCEENPLTSLKGIPKKIGHHLIIGMEHIEKFTEKYIRSLSKIKGSVLYQDENGFNYEEWEVNEEESPDDRDGAIHGVWGWDRVR